MHIVLYSLNFSPEAVGAGFYTGEMANYLSEIGHTVKIITTNPYFPEWRASYNLYKVEGYSRFKVYRCPIYIPKNPSGLTRIVHLVSFSISSFPILVFCVLCKPDLIINICPSILSGFSLLVLRRTGLCRAKTLVHVQDFELDAAFGLGILSHRFIKKLGQTVESKILRSFDHLTTISSSMRAKAVGEKRVELDRASLFPNWVEPCFLADQNPKAISDYRVNLFSEADIPAESLVLGYSGSMSRKQNFGSLRAIIHKLSLEYSNIYWLFCGSGPADYIIDDFVNCYTNVRRIPFRSREDLPFLLKSIDIHLNTQDIGAEDSVLPSKILAIMACGRPFVATARENSDLGRIAQLAGVRCDPGNEEQLLSAIRTLVNSKDKRDHLGNIGREYIAANHQQHIVLGRFQDLITKL